MSEEVEEGAVVKVIEDETLLSYLETLSENVSLSELYQTIQLAEDGYPFAMESLSYYWKYPQEQEEQENSFQEIIQEKLRNYEKQAEMNDSNGLFRIGWCYEYGIGRSSDLLKALDYYDQSILLENDKAMAHLSFLYLGNQKLPKDFNKAIYWAKLASAKGNSLGMNNLGFCLRYGQGIPKDIPQAFQLFLTAAKEHENCIAMEHLFSFYIKGDGEEEGIVERNIEEAIRWGIRAIEKGNLCTLTLFGNCYTQGIGWKHDFMIAKKWYKRAAYRGHDLGMLMYATILLSLDIKDEDDHVLWYRKAMETGHLTAIFTYASLLWSEEDQQKKLESLSLLEFAAHRGHVPSIQKLANIFQFASSEGEGDGAVEAGEEGGNQGGDNQRNDNFYAYESMYWNTLGGNYGGINSLVALSLGFYDKNRKDSISAMRIMQKVALQNSELIPLVDALYALYPKMYSK